MKKVESWYSVPTHEVGATDLFQHNPKNSQIGDHMIDSEETKAFASYLNMLFNDCDQLSHLFPLNLYNDDLFVKQSDGLILINIVNFIQPGAIKAEQINFGSNLSLFQKMENLNRAIDGAQALGCILVNIGSRDIWDGRPIQILGLLWQLLRLHFMSNIHLESFPSIALLLNDGEQLMDLLKLAPEAILLRWINYHLQRAGNSLTISNLGKGMKDPRIFGTLILQLNPAASIRLQKDVPDVDCANDVLASAVAIGAKAFITPNDLMSNKSRLKIAFAAQLFNACHGLPDLDEDMISATRNIIQNCKYPKSNAKLSSASLCNSSEIDALFPSSKAVVHVGKLSASMVDSDDETDYSSQNLTCSDALSWGSPRHTPSKTPSKYLGSEFCYLNCEESAIKLVQHEQFSDVVVSPIAKSEDDNCEAEETKDNHTFKIKQEIEVDSDDESDISRSWRETVGSPPPNELSSSGINDIHGEIIDPSRWHNWTYLPYLKSENSNSILQIIRSAIDSFTEFQSRETKNSMLWALLLFVGMLWWHVCSGLLLTIIGCVKFTMQMSLDLANFITRAIFNIIFKALSLVVWLLFDGEIVIKKKVF